MSLRSNPRRGISEAICNVYGYYQAKCIEEAIHVAHERSVLWEVPIVNLVNKGCENLRSSKSRCAVQFGNLNILLAVSL